MISNAPENIIAAHRMLEFLITKAAISGKVNKTSMRIPFKELAASVGQDKNADYDLIVSFHLSWDEHKKEEAFEENLEDDNE